MSGIWVFAEDLEQSKELLGGGRELAGKMGTTLAAFARDGELARECIRCGADEVFLLPRLAPDQPLEAYVPVLYEAARRGDPDVFLIAATPRGKEIAARLAVRLDAGLCSGCTGLGPDGGGGAPEMERMAYGGAAIQRVRCTTRPAMATVPLRTFEPAVPEEGRQGKITELEIPPCSAVRVIGRAPRQRGSVDLAAAKIIVCVGRGFEKREDIQLARGLADVVGGEVGCSRPVAEELNWMPEELYLGISGKKAKPELYIGLGVSGQIQHVTGIRDSRVILAVNRDENAPIFEAADYGIVGDLYQVVPRLVEELKAALKM